MKPAIILLSAAILLGQTPTRHEITVTVVDPYNRFTAGLEREHFEVEQGGARRNITAFYNTDAPLTIALVSANAPATDRLQPQNQLIHASTLQSAIEQLKASPTPRRILLTTTDTAPIAGIRIVRIDPAAGLDRTLTELQNQYWLEYESTTPTNNAVVTVKPPRGLPTLKAISK